MLGIALAVEDVTKGQKLAFRYPGPRGFSDGIGTTSSSPSSEGGGGGGGASSTGPTTTTSGTRGGGGSTNVGGGDQQGVGNRVGFGMDRSNNIKYDINSFRVKNPSKRKSRRRGAYLKDFWRFESELLAKLFRPSQSQCGKMFELLIDDLRFLSYGVQIDPEKLNSEEAMFVSEKQHHHQLTMFSLIFVVDADSEKILEESRQKLAQNSSSGNYGIAYPGSNEVVEMYRRAAVKLAAGMLYEEHRCGYISEQVQSIFNTVLKNSNEDDKSETTSDQQQQQQQQPSPHLQQKQDNNIIKVDTSVGNVQLNGEKSNELDSAGGRSVASTISPVLSPPSLGVDSKIDHPNSPLVETSISEQGEKMPSPLSSISGSSTIASPLSSATSNISMMINNNNNSVASPSGSSISSPKDISDSKKRKSKSGLLAAAHATLDLILKHSQLARELRDVFIGLSEFGAVDITLNGRVSLTLTLQSPSLHPFVPIRPYQSLLLFDEYINTNDSSKQSRDPSTQLERVVHFASVNGPNVSFENMALALCLPLQEVFRIAAHLIYWRKGRIVNVVSKSSVYRVSPSANLDPRSRVHFEFQKQFGKRVHIVKQNSSSSSSRRNEKKKKRHHNNNNSSKSDDDGDDDEDDDDDFEEDDFDNTKDNNGNNNGPTREHVLTLSLSRVLALFSGTNSHGKPNRLLQIFELAKMHFNIDQHECNKILIWLLQKDLVYQLKRYFYLIVPESSKYGPRKVKAGDTQLVGAYGASPADAAAAAALAAGEEVVKQVQAAEAQAAPTSSTQSPQAIHAQQTAGFTTIQPYESKSPEDSHHHCTQYKSAFKTKNRINVSNSILESEAAFLDLIATDSDVYILFRRLAQYFHGRHSETEILWRENITRDNLEKVIHMYSDLVFDCYQV